MFEQVEFILSPVAAASRGARERGSVSRTGTEGAECRVWSRGAGAGGAIRHNTPGTRELQPAAAAVTSDIGWAGQAAPAPATGRQQPPSPHSDSQPGHQRRLVRSCQAETPTPETSVAWPGTTAPTAKSIHCAVVSLLFP